MNELSEKAVRLATTAQNIATYQEMIDLLQTQVSYFQKKLKDEQDTLHTQHTAMLEASNIVTVRNLSFSNNSKQGGNHDR